MQSTYTSKKAYPYTSEKIYPILQKEKDINIKIDRLFNCIIKREVSDQFSSAEDYYEFFNIIERLEFDYTEDNMKIFKEENIEKLKIIVYCIKEIYMSRKKSLLMIATRKNLIDVYDNCKEFEVQYKNTDKEIQSFFDYYYASVIKKLEQ